MENHNEFGASPEDSTETLYYNDADFVIDQECVKEKILGDEKDGCLGENVRANEVGKDGNAESEAERRAHICRSNKAGCRALFRYSVMGHSPDCPYCAEQDAICSGEKYVNLYTKAEREKAALRAGVKISPEDLTSLSKHSIDCLRSASLYEANRDGLKMHFSCRCRKCRYCVLFHQEMLEYYEQDGEGALKLDTDVYIGLRKKPWFPMGFPQRMLRETRIIYPRVAWKIEAREGPQYPFGKAYFTTGLQKAFDHDNFQIVAPVKAEVAGYMLDSLVFALEGGASFMTSAFACDVAPFPIVALRRCRDGKRSFIRVVVPDQNMILTEGLMAEPHGKQYENR